MMSHTPEPDSAGLSGPTSAAAPVAPPIAEADSVSSAEPASRRPRVWPSLIVVPLTIVAILCAQVVLGLVFAAIYFAQGIRDPQQVVETMMGDVRFIVTLLIVNFTIIIAVAVTGGWLSRERLGARLGLVRPSAPFWSMPLIIIGTGFVWATVMTFLPLVISEPSEHIIRVAEMLAALGRSNPLLLIAMIVVLPSIVEEILIRGYVQRRITRRWGPLVGITLATIGFAVLHMDPQHAIGVIPLGVWCGFVAWRTGSVYPAMLCHGTNNGLAAMYLLLHPGAGTTAEGFEPLEISLWEVMPVPMAPFFLVSGACLVASVVVLLRSAKPLRR